MRYEIRIKGHLDQNIVMFFNNFTAEYSNDGDTILQGSVVDQSELHGILMRIRDLGLILLQVQHKADDRLEP